MSLPEAGYRPDIDGLRAVSILGVTIFHLNPAILPGGFLGVDVFFVISGYLITGIIQRSIEQDGFSFAKFYERRILRLMPALFTMIAIVSVPAAVWMWPVDLEAFGKSMKYVVISMANIHFLDFVEDYFAGDAGEVPLLHTWSLAVEEQYYLLFPPMLIFLNRIAGSGRKLTAWLWVLFAASLLACVLVGGSSRMQSFFLLPYRAWEMLIGSLLALGVWKGVGQRPAALLVWLGLAMLLGSLIFVSEQNLVPGLSAVPACMGAALLIHFGAQHTGIVKRCLSSGIFVGIGLISYSLYLWHWPLIVFRDFIVPRGLFFDAILLILSVALGFLSWKFIEQPFRVRGRFTRRRVFAAWAGMTLLLVAASQWIRKNDGFPERFPAPVARMLEYGKKDEYYSIRTKDHYDPDLAPVYGQPAVDPGIVLWGDSHAEALLPILDVMGKDRGKSFRIYKIPGQIPVLGFVTVDRDNAERDRYTREVFERIMSDKAIHTVVLHARWSLAIYGQNEIGKEDVLKDFYQRDFKDREELKKAYREGVEKVLSALLGAGKRVVLIYPIPEIGVHIPRFLAKEIQKGNPIPEFVPCLDFEHRNRDLISWFDEVPDHTSLVRIKPHLLIYSNNRAKISENGVPLYRDDDHLGKPGGEYIEKLLEPIFLDEPR